MMRSFRLLAIGLFSLAAGPAAWTTIQPEAPDTARQTVERCSTPNVSAERRCYEAALHAQLPAGGAGAALALLDELAAIDDDVRRDGHMYAHGIGIAALRSLDEMGRVFASCTPTWQSGCYHGVIQSYFLVSRRGGGAIDTASVDAICGSWRGRGGDPWLLFQCTHGLGHGLTMFHGHDLRLSLASCDLLSRAEERSNCYGGAFMENIVNVTHPHHVAPGSGGGEAAHGGHADHAQHGAPAQPAAGDHGAHAQHAGGAHADHAGHGAQPAAAAAEPWRPLDPNDMHYPCSAFAERYADACYTIQTAAMLYFNRGDVGRTAAECSRAPAPVRGTCFVSLGRDVSSIAGTNLERAVRLCSLAETRYRPNCHRGVVEAYVNMRADPTGGLPYCRAIPEREGKEACYRAIGGQAMVLVDGEARREQACRSAEPDYVDVCLGRSSTSLRTVTVTARRAR